MAATGNIDANGIAEAYSTVTLPVAFPNSVIRALATARDIGGAGRQELAVIGNSTNTTIIAVYIQSRVANVAMQADWIIFGR